jgi:ribosomal protein L7/L12
MTAVRITGWRRGLKKISHTQILHEMTGLSLREARDVTDAVLEGRVVPVIVQSDGVARELISKLRDIGADASIEE